MEETLFAGGNAVGIFCFLPQFQLPLTSPPPSFLFRTSLQSQGIDPFSNRHLPDNLQSSFRSALLRPTDARRLFVSHVLMLSTTEINILRCFR